jgi:hypothetical protein
MAIVELLGVVALRLRNLKKQLHSGAELAQVWHTVIIPFDAHSHRTSPHTNSGECKLRVHWST